MKIIFFSSKPYDEKYFYSSNKNYNYELRFVEPRLTLDTVSLIEKESVVCVFVNDILDRDVLQKLSQTGIKLIALRCAGFNNIDLQSADEFAFKVVRVPAYSPYAVAEHAVCLMLSLNRKINRAYSRVRDGNFSLDGLLGFDFHGRTIGIIGTGRIGSVVAGIVSAMGMNVLAYDPIKNQSCEKRGVRYVELDQLFIESDVITLHCPLTDETKHIIDAAALDKMKDGVMLINTSRGGVLNTCDVIQGLKSRKIGYLGLDVYEQEKDLFFEDLSCEIIQDDIFERLVTFPNVLITAHQAFFTADALKNIADTTFDSIKQFAEGMPLENEVTIIE